MSDAVRESVRPRIDNKIVYRNGCHLWTGTISHDGYGSFQVRASAKFVRDWFEMECGVLSRMAAHKVAFLADGRIIFPDEPILLHSCAHRHCVNPDHLYPGTYSDSSYGRSYNPRNNLPRVSEMERRLLRGQTGYQIAKTLGIGIGHAYHIRKRMILNNQL